MKHDTQGKIRYSFSLEVRSWTTAKIYGLPFKVQFFLLELFHFARTATHRLEIYNNLPTFNL